MSGHKDASMAAVGWTVFAATMMLIIGSFWIIAGLAGVIGDNTVVVTQDYVFAFDTTTWGWIHLLVGLLVLLAGFGLFSGAVWARTVGVVIAVVNAIVAFAWLPHYPFWAITIIAIDIAVIWSLTSHGRDITRA